MVEMSPKHYVPNRENSEMKTIAILLLYLLVHLKLVDVLLENVHSHH